MSKENLKHKIPKQDPRFAAKTMAEWAERKRRTNDEVPETSRAQLVSSYRKFKHISGFSDIISTLFLRFMQVHSNSQAKPCSSTSFATVNNVMPHIRDSIQILIAKNTSNIPTKTAMTNLRNYLKILGVSISEAFNSEVLACLLPHTFSDDTDIRKKALELWNKFKVERQGVASDLVSPIGNYITDTFKFGIALKRDVVLRGIALPLCSYHELDNTDIQKVRVNCHMKK